jgi:hypothetical protein
MDPVFAFAAELWWLGPVVIGGGAASFAAIRYGRRHRERTIEYAAARHELDVARARLHGARAQVTSARAAMLAAKSERQAGRAGTGAMDAARRSLGDAQREMRSAQTALQGRRVQVRAARIALRGMPRDDEHLPTARLVAAHDAVVSRWMEYETDPAKAIAFPTMTDTRVPATSALLTALDRARWLRPTSPKASMTPEAYSHYRAAVTDLEAAFQTAEADAWRAAGATGGPGGRSGLGGGGLGGGGLGGDTGSRPSIPPQLRGAWDDLVQSARSTASAAAAAAPAWTLDAVLRATRGQGRDDAHDPAERTRASDTAAAPEPPQAPEPEHAPEDSPAERRPQRSEAPPAPAASSAERRPQPPAAERRSEPPPQRNPRPEPEPRREAPASSSIPSPSRRVWPVPRRSSD